MNRPIPPAKRLVSAIAAVIGACSLGAVPTYAEEPVPAPESGWIVTDWTPSLGEAVEAEGDQETGIGEADAEQRKSALPAMRLGNNEVRLAPVAGAPGAKVKPDGSNVSLGVGVQPLESAELDPLEGRRYEQDTEPLADLDNGLSGALSLSETRGSVTQTMSVTSPITGGEAGDEDGTAKSNDVRTMFGLGYKF